MRTCVIRCKIMLYCSVLFRISAATYRIIDFTHTILSYFTFCPVILCAVNGAECFHVVSCWYGAHWNYNLRGSSWPNMETSPSLLFSMLFHNLASSCATEKTNLLYTIMYGGSILFWRYQNSCEILHLWSIWRKCTRDNSKEGTVSILLQKICICSA